MERDRRDYVIKNGESDFNSHAHVERDVEVSFHKYGSAISTHTLTWSVTVSYAVTEIIRVISTHTLTWSVTILSFLQTQTVLDFNSHAHVERDLRLIVETFPFVISTHTLTWSVTINIFDIFSFFHISTHTLTWSVTIVFNGIIFQ